MDITSIKFNFNDYKNFELSDKRMASIIKQNKNGALDMGIWDKIKDLFRPEKKEKALNEFYCLIHKVNNPNDANDVNSDEVDLGYIGNFYKLKKYADPANKHLFEIDKKSYKDEKNINKKTFTCVNFIINTKIVMKITPKEILQGLKIGKHFLISDYHKIKENEIKKINNKENKIFNVEQTKIIKKVISDSSEYCKKVKEVKENKFFVSKIINGFCGTTPKNKNVEDIKKPEEKILDVNKFVLFDIFKENEEFFDLLKSGMLNDVQFSANSEIQAFNAIKNNVKEMTDYNMADMKNKISEMQSQKFNITFDELQKSIKFYDVNDGDNYKNSWVVDTLIKEIDVIKKDNKGQYSKALDFVVKKTDELYKASKNNDLEKFNSAYYEAKFMTDIAKNLNKQNKETNLRNINRLGKLA